MSPQKFFLSTCSTLGDQYYCACRENGQLLHDLAIDCIKSDTDQPGFEERFISDYIGMIRQFVILVVN